MKYRAARLNVELSHIRSVEVAGRSLPMIGLLLPYGLLGQLPVVQCEQSGPKDWRTLCIIPVSWANIRRMTNRSFHRGQRRTRCRLNYVTTAKILPSIGVGQMFLCS